MTFGILVPFSVPFLFPQSHLCVQSFSIPCVFVYLWTLSFHTLSVCHLLLLVLLWWSLVSSFPCLCDYCQLCSHLFPLPWFPSYIYILAVSPCSLLDHLSLSLLKRPLVFLSSSLAGLSQFAGISCLVSVVYCFLVTPFGLLCFSDFLKQTTQQFNSTCLCVPAFWSST